MWTVDFQNGVYTYRCDAHASTMIGQVTVGAIPTVKLTASVGPAKRISLRDSTGAKVTTLSGPVDAVITVNDRRRVDNFHLSGPGVNKRTGVGFRGRVTWHFLLSAGKYIYRSDKHKTLRAGASQSPPGNADHRDHPMCRDSRIGGKRRVGCLRICPVG